MICKIFLLLLLAIVPITKSQAFNCSIYGVAGGKTVNQSLLCNCQDGTYNCTKYYRNKCVNLTTICLHCGEKASENYCVQKNSSGSCGAGYVPCSTSKYCVKERYICTRHICSHNEYQCPINSFNKCVSKHNVCERCEKEDVCVAKGKSKNCTDDTVECGDRCFSFEKACYTCKKNQYPCGPNSSTTCVEDPCRAFCSQALCSPMPDAGCDPESHLYCSGISNSLCLSKKDVCDKCGNGNTRCPAWSPRKCVNRTEVNALCSSFCNSSTPSLMCTISDSSGCHSSHIHCQELGTKARPVCIDLDFVCEHTKDKIYPCDAGRIQLWLNKTQVEASCNKYCGEAHASFCRPLQNQKCLHESFAPCTGRHADKCILTALACDDCGQNSLECHQPYPRCINESQIMDQCNKFCSAGNCTAKKGASCKGNEVECMGKFSNKCLPRSLACECDHYCRIFPKESCLTKERVSEFCQFCNVSNYCEKKQSPTARCPGTSLPCPNGQDCVDQLVVCGGGLIPSHSVFQCGAGYKSTNASIQASYTKCKNEEACVKYSQDDIEPCLLDEFMCVKNRTCIPKSLTCGCLQNQTRCTPPQQKFCVYNESIRKLCSKESTKDLMNVTAVPKSQSLSAIIVPAVFLSTLLSVVMAAVILSLFV